MFVLMLWTQKFEFGKLIAGAAYDMTGRETLANDLIKREMAREVTKEELAKLNAQVVSLDPSHSDVADVAAADAKAALDAKDAADAKAAADATAKPVETGGNK